MSESVEEPTIQTLKTYLYTYEVSATVHVLANNLEQAQVILDSNSGYLSKRVVNLISTTTVFDEE